MNLSLVLGVVLLSASIQPANGKLKSITIPALGRSFSLGDLYDRRRDVIVQGPKLWSYKELVDYIESKSYSTRFEIVTSETINEDMKQFDLSASVKMSFLAGLITVSGSASYLDDRKRKNNQARVSLNYKSTTFKRELKPRLFTKVTYPDVLKKTDATDVVVAIQYGAGAIFTFDRSVKQNEDKREISGSLAIAVKKIPTFEISGEGKVEINEQDKKNTESFTCKFHGDFILKTHPGTYQEAIKVYKQLPEYLGSNYENSVSVKVWLYPLEKLPLSRSAEIVHEIKESFVVSVTDQIEDLENIIRQCNDILDSEVSTRHERIRMKVDDFKRYVARYVILYKQKLVTLLPGIRKGDIDTSKLTSLVTEKENSPFKQRNLQSWISRLKEEVSVLSRIQNLPNYCRNTGEFSAKLLSGKKHTLGLILKIGKTEDTYLNAMKRFLKNKNNNQLPSQNIANYWWSPGSKTLSDLQVLSSTFKEFYQIKKKEAESSLSSPNVQFLVQEEIIQTEELLYSIIINQYEGAKLLKTDYQLTSAPGRPYLKSKGHDFITIEWNAPQKGLVNLQNYIIRVYIVQTKGMSDKCDGNYCEVSEKVVSKSKNEFTVDRLRSQTPYYFTVASLTELGETANSKKSDLIETKDCVPGFYNIGNQTCKQCSKGTYSQRYGQKFCDKCPLGTYGDSLGLKELSECQLCPKGTYNEKEGSESAFNRTKCPTGRYNSDSGSRSFNACTKCPKGSYNSYMGQSSSSACFKCKTNTYNNHEGASNCKACPSGMRTNHTGAVYMSECQLPSNSSAQIQVQLKAMKDQLNSQLEIFADKSIRCKLNNFP